MHFWPAWTAAIAMALTACVSTPAAQPDGALLAPAPLPTNAAAIPVSRETEPLWVNYLHRITTEAEQQPDTGLLFLGDSITQGFRAHQDLWQTYYGPFKPLNGGIWADSTQHLLWRITHGTFAAIDPKLVVLMIGVNNGPNTAVEIAEGIAVNTRAALSQFPHAKVLILGILPYGKDPRSANRRRCTEANALVSELADGQRIFYLDLSNNFVDPEGHLNQALYRSDSLHLSKQGYVVWAQAMQPELSHLWTL